MQALLTLVYSIYRIQKLPKFNLILILELMMVAFGPVIAKVYFQNSQKLPNRGVLRSNLSDGSS